LDVLHTTTAPRPRQAAVRPTSSGWPRAGPARSHLKGRWPNCSA